MVKALGRKTLTGVCNLSSAEDVGKFTEQVMSQFGRCDILVNEENKALLKKGR